MFSRVLLAAIVVLLVSAAAWAQQVIQMTMEDISGKVVQTARGGIIMTDAGGRKWSVTVPRDATIKVTGRASQDVLAPGIYVRFLADLDRRTGRSQEPLKRITIFNPVQGDPERMPGAARAGVAGIGEIAPGAGGAPLPGDGVGPLDLDGGKPPAGTRPGRTPVRRRPVEKPAGGPQGNVESYDVRGQVVSFKNGRMSVAAPSQLFRGKINVELADDAAVDVDLTDYTVAKAGDAITARVIYRTAGSGQAKDVKIELVQPLGNPGKKPRKPAGKQQPEVEGPAEGPAEPAAPGKGKPAAKTPARKTPAKGKPADDDLPEIKDAPPEGKAEARPDPEAAKLEKGEQIRKLLSLKPEELQGRPTLQVGLQGGEVQPFSPCKNEPAKNIRDKFGPPDSTADVNGMFPDEQGKQRQVQWQLWTYGHLKFFVDENGKVLYYTWGK